MDRSMDFNNFSNQQNFNSYETNFDSQMYDTPLVNPAMQYEQAYMYYRYMTQQLEYKIKCKEYDKLCNSSSPSRNERRE